MLECELCLMMSAVLAEGVEIHGYVRGLAIHKHRPSVLASRLCGTTKAAQELMSIDCVAPGYPILRLRLRINATYDTITLLLARSSCSPSSPAPQNAVFTYRPLLPPLLIVCYIRCCRRGDTCIGTVMLSSFLLYLNFPIVWPGLRKVSHK